MGTRHWNGWIDEGAEVPRISEEAGRLLEAEIGPGRPQPDAPLADVVAALAASAFVDDAGGRLSLDPIDRIRHARGQRPAGLGRAPQRAAGAYAGRRGPAE